MYLITVYYYMGSYHACFAAANEEELQSLLNKMEPNVGIKHEEPFVSALNPASAYEVPGQVFVDAS